MAFDSQPDTLTLAQNYSMFEEITDKLYYYIPTDKPVHPFKSKVPIGFNCTDSFWPLTCEKIQIGAHASVQIKTQIPLYLKSPDS